MYEDRYVPTKPNQAGPAPGPMQADQMKAFASVRNELDIALTAATAAEQSLTMLCGRLGIAPSFGVAVKVGEPPVSGEIEATEQHARRVTEIARSVRGLAETLEARL